MPRVRSARPVAREKTWQSSERGYIVVKKGKHMDYTCAPATATRITPLSQPPDMRSILSTGNLYRPLGVQLYPGFRYTYVELASPL